jgi:hypothetical protein
MANLGLVAKPNQDVHRTNDAVPGNQEVNVVELFNLLGHHLSTTSNSFVPTQLR